MERQHPSFWNAFMSRDDLKRFKEDALSLFALQVRFGMEDISTVASNSLIEASDDKKADLVHIDSEAGYCVIAQSYNAVNMDKKEAPSNKASDLNTAVSWLLSRPLEQLPESIKSHAQELRQAIEAGSIRFIHLWYVHNLQESVNVREELITVEHSAQAAFKSTFPDTETIEIQAQEVGVSTIEGWYKSISTPILVSEEFTIPIGSGFEIREADWAAYVTSVPAKWLYETFQKYKTELFSANVRDYLGSRKVDRNINYGIRTTAHEDPTHFWVFNNGITALVHSFQEYEKDDKLEIRFKGISILNGAQTTGAIGNLDNPPDENAKVQVRFITCDNRDTLYNIVRYNNSQNKITAADFRSKDTVQRRLQDEFRYIPSVQYFPRRGGHEDVIKRRLNVLLSVTAGQALAAFHQDPDIAYHARTHMWESDRLYSQYFHEQTTAKHVVFAYSLLKSVESKKFDLLEKSKAGSLIEIEKEQLSFFRQRGSTFLLTSAISRCLELILNKPVPNSFNLSFQDNLSPQQAAILWVPIVDIASSFTEPLSKGLSDGIRNRKAVTAAVLEFQRLMASTKQPNEPIYAEFRGKIT